MTQQGWVDILRILAWPIIFYFSLLSLRKPIADLIKRLEEGEYKGIKFKATSEEHVKSEINQKIEDLKQLTKNFESLYDHEEPFPNTEAAFTAASSYIAAYLDDCRKNNKSEVKVELKLLAIAMTFSWSFVTEHIPAMLKKYPEAKIDIKIVVADPDFLNKLDIDKDSGINWAEKCLTNIKEIRNLVKDKSRHHDRLSIELRAYKNIPHWHGLLINGNHLFLGRADWEFNTELPKFTVGQNTYRHFGEKEIDGERSKKFGNRIKLFENWHRYYFESSKKIRIKY